MSAPVTFTISLHALTSDALNAAMIAHLTARGYVVCQPREHSEKVCAFMARIGLRKHESFHRSLRLWEARGHIIPRDCGASGRLISLQSNPAFDAFCRRNKR